MFDCLNWVENMRVSMDAVREAGKLCEGAFCYTGDILDPDRAKYSLKYYVGLAKELEAAGAHIIGIKDMAGLLKPAAARKLVATLRQETGLPIHFHTHDTSGRLGGLDDGGGRGGRRRGRRGDGFDERPHLAADLGSLVEALPMATAPRARRRGDPRDLVLLGSGAPHYRAFESDLRFGASEVYLHEMPGGQFTNLKEQARSLGLESRWHEVAQTYAEVNMMFGDIVKVTPSSKVVGDMALAMVGRADAEEVEDPNAEIAFPDSVVGFFAGDLGQPPGGFPEALQKKVLKGRRRSTSGRAR
jgi:pyruvate carboxylase